jgi:UDP-glucose 4-epimerase
MSEDCVVWDTTNPYWTTKLIIEHLLRDLSKTSWFRVVNLRYFNPIWAHKSWLIWEDPKWIPNNLLPFIMKVVSKELPEISVFWNDYDTVDWTGVRDYIHVVDLANWHLKSYNYLEQWVKSSFFEVFNLWTWKWTSVLEMINITKKLTWKDLPYTVVLRRDWDLAEVYCNPIKAKKMLWWSAIYSVEEAIKDSLNFINNK